MKKEFLCTSPKAEKILPVLREYSKASDDNILFKVEDYTIFYFGEITPDRLNELRMFCLGVYYGFISK